MHRIVMTPPSPETRVTACWSRTASIEELLDMLDDDREWVSGSTPNFDGDAWTDVHFVSVWALRALAEVAPTAAPVDKIAAKVLQHHGRVIEIQTCTWAAPHEVHLHWSSQDLAPFGAPLVAALRAALDDADADTRRRAREVLADIGL